MKISVVLLIFIYIWYSNFKVDIFSFLILGNLIFYDFSICLDGMPDVRCLRDALVKKFSGKIRRLFLTFSFVLHKKFFYFMVVVPATVCIFDPPARLGNY